MKILLIIYIVSMLIYDIVVGVEVGKTAPPEWTQKEFTKAIILLVALGLIWPICLGIALWKYNKQQEQRERE